MTRASSSSRLCCVVCGRADDVHLHHVALAAYLPAVTVPVCRSRHAAWHRRLYTAGAVLGGTREGGSVGERGRLLTIAVGFRVVLEDGAALADHPLGVRASVRRRTAATLSLIDAVLPAPPGQSAVAVRPCSRGSAPRPLLSEDLGDCRPRSARGARRHQWRAELFIGWALGALAGLLEAILPGELDGLGLSRRLRAIDPSRLAAVALGAEGEEPASHVDVEGIASRPVESVAEGGSGLDALVSELEAWSNG